MRSSEGHGGGRAGAPGLDAAARAAAARTARESYGKLVAYLAAPNRDVPGAEDALADAFAAALTAWPAQGVPSNPEGWLVTTARRRMIDAARRRRSAEAATGALTMIDEELKAAEGETSIPDRRLALMFACAHPAIDESIRAPLMLQTILGLDAAAIASAFLVSPAAMGQRLARAKGKIRLAGVPFRIPEPRTCPSVSAPSSRRFTPPSRMAGRRRSPTIPADAIWPRRRSGSAASSSRSQPTSRRRKASWR